MLIYTIETHAEHKSGPGYGPGSLPHTVGYFLSHFDAIRALVSVRLDYPSAYIHKYPIGTVLYK